ncbi:hypothetical protein ACFPIK_15870 [Algoriphagus aquatilis]|uniref:6-bladed beta-propeller protein n=2 Tax=Bacteroidota TaxID=976 RepID=A0ABW0C020_9BACT
MAKGIVLHLLQIAQIDLLFNPKARNFPSLLMMFIYMNKFVLVVIGIFIFSCQRESQSNVPLFQEKNLTLNSIEFDSLIFDKDYFSGVGFFSVGRDELFFVDQVFSTVIAFDKNGHSKGTFLGKGDGPDEQNNIHGFLPYATGDNHMVLDNFEFVVFDQDFQKVSSYPIEWDYSESYQDMLNNPHGSMLGLYEIAWSSKGNNTSFLTLGNAAEVILPVTMSHPRLNGYISEEYYKSVSVFGRYDLSKRKVIEGFGIRSEKYLSHLYIPNFDFSFFTKRKDEILASFAIDPLIHVFDSEGTLKYKFGVEGEGIQSTYPITNTIDDALDNYKVDLEKAGFYHAIYSDESNGLTFRTYYPTGSKAGNARLQIYENNVLIGDVLVPARFHVIGKIGDTYYADGIIEELNDRLGIYTFKLDLK